MRDRKYKYLYQLMVTCAILVIIPIVFFDNIVWKKAIHEINYLNKEYYNNALDSFCGAFTNKTTKFRNHVIEFSAESRTSQLDGGIFYQGTEKMEEEAYYYEEAVKKLAEYGREFGYRSLGVYYYEKGLSFIVGAV